MLLYVMASPSQFDAGIFKIGEADGRYNLNKRLSSFQTAHYESVDIHALWDIGDIGAKADNRIHGILNEYRFGDGGTEFFKGVSIDEVHKWIIHVFGEERVKRLK